MKKLLFILITLNSVLFGVGEAGAIFLLISPSPTINGFAGAGTSISTTDIYSSYYNPAQPQLPNGLSIQFSDTKTNWLPNLASDIIYNYDVKMIGYNGFSLFIDIILFFSSNKNSLAKILFSGILKGFKTGYIISLNPPEII